MPDNHGHVKSTMWSDEFVGFCMLFLAKIHLVSQVPVGCDCNCPYKFEVH